ncbi:aminoacyl-tRNA hydrolase [Schaalia sp. ZJ405]|uniref:aminoacyl-tRNA hydrolase n=1 Tax=Schaalia sp. ZJ405 TaxID=2709403 RepID=UPI0013EBAC92|nr:aminoacyl-tRNA hydrolase [Schaalia sp. ZJ405]QPK80881.1 aminoacyl-tRNA hydrolase [Schaalia sp. ZJ405]
MPENTPWVVLGLGNPGPEYANTRHNVGYLTVDVLATRMGESLKSHRSRTHIADGRLGMLPGGIPGPRVILARSDSYMNTTGGPVGRLMSFLGIPPQKLLVIHDDLDLQAHDLRLKFSGGEGGHNGLKSLSQNLGTKDYHRLRIGIGRPPGRQNPADYVLSAFPVKDRPDWEVTFEQAADAVEDVVLSGFLAAQQSLHSR